EAALPSPGAVIPLGLRVLVVDDEPDSREFLQVALENAGARVTVVESVEAALAQFRQQPPDILLSDIAMPEADGYSLIQTIRRLPPEQGGQVPAAALTAFARESDKARAIAAGFQLHVPKPLDPDHLIRVVAELARHL
ncbi:MAG: response regulator, partial [Elainella sp.]